MKRIYMLMLGMFMAVSIFAQKNDTIQTRIHEFGAQVGSTTGIGLSYRYWPKKLGLQVTLLPIKTTDLTFISVGVTGLCSFYQSEYVRFFGYLGNTLLVNNYKEDQYNSTTGSYTKGPLIRNTTYNVGFGPGFGFGSRIRVNIMCGYGMYDIGGDFLILPAGEIGLYFRL